MSGVMTRKHVERCDVDYSSTGSWRNDRGLEGVEGSDGEQGCGACQDEKVSGW